MVEWRSVGYALLTHGYKPQLRFGLCSFRTVFAVAESVRWPYLINLLDLCEILEAAAGGLLLVGLFDGVGEFDKFGYGELLGAFGEEWVLQDGAILWEHAF